MLHDSMFVKQWKARKEVARVVAIHGMMAHSGYFEYFGRFASRRGITVIAPDLKGYGRSPGERGRIGNIYEHLEALERLADSDTFLLGHSLGAIYAIHYAYFHHARGLVLASPGFFLKQYPETLRGMAEIGLAFFTDPSKMFDTTRFWSKEARSLKEASAVMADRGCTKSFDASYLASMFRLQVSAYLKLPSLAMPGLFLIGKHDRIVYPSSMLLAYLLYKGRKSMMLAPAGHTLSCLFSLHQEKTRLRERLADAIVEWLKREA